MKREPFPLQWPDGWPRTPADQRARLGVGAKTLYESTRSLLRQVSMLAPTPLGAPRIKPVLTSDLPASPDGLPLPGSFAEDPGVAVYWTWRGVEHVIACDRWMYAADNIRAVAKTVHLLRELGTWSPVELSERVLQMLAAPARDTGAQPRGGCRFCGRRGCTFYTPTCAEARQEHNEARAAARRAMGGA